MVRKKVYVIAGGMITSLGRGMDRNVAAIRSGFTGVSLHGGFLKDGDGKDIPVMCGLVPEGIVRTLEEEFASGEKKLTRLELLAAGALSDAVSDAGSRGRETCSGKERSTERRALVLSSTKGNIGILKEPDCGIPDLPEDVFPDVTAKKIGRLFGYSPDDVYTVSNACISGVSSMVVAKRFIEYGLYDEVAVVGADELSEFIVSGFASFRSLSPEPCRPYDASRCGLNLGEAAAAVILSSRPESGAIVLSGGSVSDDANHISGPSRTGDGLYFAMRDAMEDAGVSREDISFVSLHGTATVYNDEMESKAVSLAGLSETPVQSLKPYTGHTLGASGVVETLFCIRQMQSGELWGTPGFRESGVPMPLDVSAESKRIGMRHCIKTASGFGGCNAAIVLSLPEYAADLPAKDLVETAVLRRTVLDRGTLSSGSGPEDFHSLIREKFRSSGLNDMKFYKMDDMCKLGYIASHILLEGLQFSPEDMAVVLQNRSASLDSDLKHLHNILSGPGASPAVFVYTLPNVASGEISIRYRIKGENTFFISSSYRKKDLETYAAAVLSSSRAKYCIVGWLEFLGEEYEADFELLGKKDGGSEPGTGKYNH